MKFGQEQRLSADGRYYNLNDMVKLNCDECAGCSACCQGMGDTVVLNPLDIYRMSRGLVMSGNTSEEGKISVGFMQLMEKWVGLHVEDGILLPHMQMVTGSSTDTAGKCGFLDDKGRCSIHSFRPSICRIFPLGRNFDGEDFQYFVLEGDCPKERKTKIKVSKWIGTDHVKENHKFINDWHYFMKAAKTLAVGMKMQGEASEERLKQMNMTLLQLFFIQPYQAEDERNFYTEFAGRLEQGMKIIEAEK
ncbi:MAG: YkgJ family cysteine cluster protein [Lachnospiraceae bacterium]|nr:YkgJ family cysteine cluster protein [Lachnospiraceae bacterium]